MSSNINDYVRPTDKSTRRDINKILSLIHDLVAQEPESEGLQERIMFTPHVKRRTSTVTFGSTDASNTDDRDRQNFIFRKKIPAEVTVYDIIHTTTGTLTFTEDSTKLGGAATFDGSSYITITDHAELSPSTISFGGWFYLPATASSDSASQNLITKGVYSLTIDPHSTASNQLRASVTIGSGDLELTNTFTPNSWNHIWVTFGSAGLKLYLNNSLVGTNSTTGTLNSNSDNLVIG